MRLAIFSLTFLLLSNLSHAELSGETKEAHALFNMLMAPYRQCVESVDKYNYWKYESGCYLIGERIGGGDCEENADTSLLQNFVPATDEHCLAHKPTEEEFYRILNSNNEGDE